MPTSVLRCYAFTIFLLLGGDVIACKFPHRESISPQEYGSLFQDDLSRYKVFVLREDWSGLLDELSDLEVKGYLELALESSVKSVLNQSAYNENFLPEAEYREGKSFYTPGYFLVRSLIPVNGYLDRKLYREDLSEAHSCRLTMLNQIIKDWFTEAEPDHYLRAAQLMAIGRSDEKQCRNIVIGNIEACESLSRKDILLAYRRLRLTEATSGYDNVDVLNYLETLNNYITLPCMEIGDDDLISIDRDIERDLLENHCADGQ
jgi:hypothetical protein